MIDPICDRVPNGMSGDSPEPGANCPMCDREVDPDVSPLLCPACGRQMCRECAVRCDGGPHGAARFCPDCLVLQDGFILCPACR